MASASLKVAIAGGGWAGCAAAVELVRRGHRITLFEGARMLGGRARCIESDGRLLDNGQHILLGAYTETLGLMRAVGMRADDALIRLPLQMRYPAGCDGMNLVAPRLPAPFHMLAGLLRTKGLAAADKMSLARFSTTARWMDWRLDTDCSVSELLERFDQTDRLIRLMWRPLCIAALNTPPERASARIFLNVLRDSLGARRAASDMLIPRIGLSALFPQRAAQFIERHEGRIEYGAAVKRIVRHGTRWRVEAGNASLPTDGESFDAIVVATQANQAARLLDGLIDTAPLGSLDYEPITTCYLQYDPALRLPEPFFALTDSADDGEWGQFVFDRGRLDANQAGLLAVVISASTDAIDNGHEALVKATAAQLARAFRQPALSNPVWTKVISEKRATFSCTPGLVRPGNETGLKGLVLAGDYTASDYPATLESAVRSGLQAARCIG